MKITIPAEYWSNFWVHQMPVPYCSNTMRKKLREQYSIFHWRVNLDGTADIHFLNEQDIVAFKLGWA